MGLVGTQLTNFKQLIEDYSYFNINGAGDAAFVPSLQSDYTIVIVPEYKIQTDSTLFQNLIVTNIGTGMLGNGFGRTKDKLGFPTADFSFNKDFDFGYIATPYYDIKTRKTYTSLVHYYYNQQITAKGTFRIKTNDWNLPALFVVNLHTNKVVYEMYDCMFTYPTYMMSPSNNDIIVYKTNVSFSKYKEFLFDDYAHRDNPAKIKKQQ